MVTSLNSRTVAREMGYEMVQYIAGRLTLAGADATVKIGTLPAGSVIQVVNTRVATAFSGGTPVFGVGSVAAGGAVPGVGASGNVAASIAIAAGTVNTVPLAALGLPLTVDTDVYAGTTGGSTAGDCVIAVQFIKPLA